RKHALVGMAADYDDLSRIEREQVAIVLEEHDRLFGIGAADGFIGDVVDRAARGDGIVDEPLRVHRTEHSPRHVVEPRTEYLPGRNRLLEERTEIGLVVERPA